MRRESGGDEPDLIGREDSSAAQAEDAKFECSQGFIIDPAAKAKTGATQQGIRGQPGGRESGKLENQSTGNAEGHRLQGNLKFSPSASQGNRMCGATRRFGLGETGRGQTRGNSGGCQPVPEDSQSGATRQTGRRRYRKTGPRGNPEPGQSAPPKDESDGATRNSIAGKAGDA